MNNGPLVFLGLFITMAGSWLAFIWGPQIQLGDLGQTNTVAYAKVLSQTYPLAEAGVAHQGAEVYRANNCAACHTEEVRPKDLSSDIYRGWGARRSVAEDYIYQTPVMLGNLRVGPDLANFGTRGTRPATIFLRLYDPRLITKGSLMPTYRFMFEKRKISGAPSPDALVLPPDLAPPAGYEIVPRAEAKALADYLSNLRQTGFLFDAPPPFVQTNAAAAATNSTAKPK
jgi:cytochrome c oxidase cbb3-type subunit 2